MNNVIITGNLASDPEAYTTQNGVSRSTFRVAVQRRYKNEQGGHDVDFFSVVAWRAAADFCNKYLKKGRKVAVEGAMQCRSYEKDGAKHYLWELNAENVEAIGRPNDTQGEKPQASDEYTEVDDPEMPF